MNAAIFRPNFARSDNSENVPPSLAKPSLPLRQHFGLHDNGARRRRARVSGTFGKKKAENAVRKQRVQAKAPSAASTSRPRKTVRRRAAAPQPQQQTQPQCAPFPSGLPRLPTKGPISKETLASMDECLRNIPAEYIRKTLATFGPRMIRTLSSIEADAPRDSLVPELDILVRDLSYEAPSHFLAVHGPPPPPINGVPQKNPVQLHPVHSLNLALYCENLPILPPCRDPGQLVNGNTAFRRSVPVVTLRLPCPETFAPLTRYMCVRNLAPLLPHMFPVPVSSLPSLPALFTPGDAGITARANFARFLAKTYTTQVLRDHMAWILSTWKNILCLGMVDPPLLTGLDLAYATLSYAIWASQRRTEELTKALGQERAKEMLA
jgi:hypothetical protein